MAYVYKKYVILTNRRFTLFIKECCSTNELRPRSILYLNGIQTYDKSHNLQTPKLWVCHGCSFLYCLKEQKLNMILAQNMPSTRNTTLRLMSNVVLPSLIKILVAGEEERRTRYVKTQFVYFAIWTIPLRWLSCV